MENQYDVIVIGAGNGGLGGCNLGKDWFINTISPEVALRAFGVEEFIAKMEYYIPGSRESIEQIFSYCEDIQRAADYIEACHGNPDPVIMLRDHHCSPNGTSMLFFMKLYSVFALPTTMIFFITILFRQR
ncbi:MAG: hypothetical protein HZB51_29695 [Chloroflexi bacterium]|nr:hypothetical protein [Chloroflexota bacterium]